MTKVYRIEHATRGLGPYQGGATMDFDYFSDRHPGPSRDGIFGQSWDHYYGFATMKQMFTWFHWIDVFKWHRQGFRVYKYTMPDAGQVIFGGRQVAFVKARAKYRHEVRLAQLAKHLVRMPLLGS